MSDFKREHRYFVFKIKYLPVWAERILREISNCISSAALPTCVVVEEDWPEYEQTWDAIEKRVTTYPECSGDPEDCPENEG